MKEYKEISAKSIIFSITVEGSTFRTRSAFNINWFILVVRLTEILAHLLKKSDKKILMNSEKLKKPIMKN